MLTMDARDLLRPLLARRLNATERREIAEQLRQLAAEQERLAAADVRAGHILRRQQLDSAPRKGGRPKGTGARFLRIEPRRNGIGATIHVGRALWQELGEPRRLDPQRIGAVLALVPCADSQGYSVTQPTNGMPRFTVGQDVLDTLRIESGRRYDAAVHAGMIRATE